MVFIQQSELLLFRCENEKMLMTMYGIEEEDIMGNDIAQETKSYFLDLMSMGMVTSFIFLKQNL